MAARDRARLRELAGRRNDTEYDVFRRLVESSELASAVSALLDRIDQLEEAGEAMFNNLDGHCDEWDAPGCSTCIAAMAWRALSASTETP